MKTIMGQSLQLADIPFFPSDVLTRHYVQKNWDHHDY